MSPFDVVNPFSKTCDSGSEFSQVDYLAIAGTVALMGITLTTRDKSTKIIAGAGATILLLISAGHLIACHTG